MKMKKLVLILIVILTLFALASCGSSSPSVTEAQMTIAVDDNANPIDKVESYNPNANKFVVAAKMKNVKQDTYVTFVWKQGQETLYENKLDVKNNTNIYASLENEQLCKEGNYSVEIYVNESKKPDKVVNFTVDKATSSVKITDAHMTTNTDNDGKPVNTVTSYKTNDSKFTVSAILRNAPNNTKIMFSWVYNGNEIKMSVLDSGTSAGGDRYFHGYLTNTKGWQEGEYSVFIYEQDNPDSGTVVNFTVVK
ncbi:MAG: hypothetical protein AAGU14_11705 [Eubacteriaceae bacterium]